MGKDMEEEKRPSWQRGGMCLPGRGCTKDRSLRHRTTARVAGAGAASGEQRAMRDQRQSWLEKRAGAGARRASHRFEFDSKPCRRGRDTCR